jgi:hypothetical protein
MSEGNASKKFIRQIWWPLVFYPGKSEGSRSWYIRCGISRMDDPTTKCLDGNGDYVEWCLDWNVQFLFSKR